MRFSLIVAVTTAFGTAVSADPSFLLDLDARDVTVSTVDYACGEDERIAVEYVNFDTNMLALMPVDGVPRVFVNVLSGSGARYVSGPYEWWSKGDGATLTDLTKDEAAVECTAVDR
ncbi:hypothetical protein EU805_05025 [Salipiger sp. IMCC34102]|nr:hypothetical protein EU805_05025 [Salipiger sp. IMCC34102]